jgi:hypothetical protein
MKIVKREEKSQWKGLKWSFRRKLVIRNSRNQKFYYNK